MKDAIKDVMSLARQTRALEIGFDILENIPQIFRRQFPGAAAIVVADRNTIEAAGEKVIGLVKGAAITVAEVFIFDDSCLYAEYGYVERLKNVLSRYDAIPIAVGSGTINDIVKLASHETSRSYLCVATAASMDGYTAFGASITADNKKQTFSCPAPRACIADTDIIRRAPESMTASGYADLFAKITAGADWILADRLEEEALDPVSWTIAQGSVKETLAAAGDIRKGDTAAIEMLVDGLMLSGFAMQVHESSRPASGAEHQFSHLWNMEHHTNNGKAVSHGFQVAIGTLAVTALYQALLETPLENLDVERCIRRWPSERQLIDKAADMFNNTDFPDIGIVETLPKYISGEDLRNQLGLLKRIWPEIRRDLKRQLVPFGEVKRLLGIAGAPTEPEHIGISRKYLRDSFMRAQFIRRRYTVLDLAVRTGMLETWLDVIFGTGGVWDLDSRLIQQTGPATAVGTSIFTQT